jgi:hypothetical protein
MQHASLVFYEREVVTATGGLVMSSIYRETRVVTEQQGANGAMADKEYVPGLIPSQNVFDLAHDAQLGIDCSLPSADAHSGLCEELIGHRRKFAGWQVTCC